MEPPADPAPTPVLELSARMLNEFVYCPRLFYYEFVDGVFVHNADTLRGAHLHRRVDSGTGKLPPHKRQSLRRTTRRLTLPRPPPNLPTADPPMIWPLPVSAER